MRIIAGSFGGRALAAVGKGDAGAHLRPTSDRVRESLFSMLASRDLLEGVRVLDLFAGTGALGLEALSRGAAEVLFIENGRVGQRLITQNIKTLGAADTSLMRMDATRLGPCKTAPFDLIFLDPPYGKGLGEQALAAGLAGGWFGDYATVVWEENAPMNAPDGFQRADSRRYGDTHITLLERAS